jgi:hypothetical protein
MNLFKNGKTTKPVLEETAKAERAHQPSEYDRLWGAYRRLADKLEAAVANTENRLRILEKARSREQVAGSRAGIKARSVESTPAQAGADADWERLERQIRG